MSGDREMAWSSSVIHGADNREQMGKFHFRPGGLLSSFQKPKKSCKSINTIKSYCRLPIFSPGRRWTTCKQPTSAMKYDAIDTNIMLRRSSPSLLSASSSPTSCDHSKDRQEYSTSIMPSSISNLSTFTSSSSELRKSIRISYNFDSEREVNRSHEDCRGVGDSSHSHSCQPDTTYVKEFHIRKQGTVLLLCYLASLLAFSIIPGTVGIDCFKCVSLNGDNPSCEDPFHNNYSVSILESPCMGGRKGRNGLFPATACIKLAGRYWDTGESMVVRSCAVDSGTLTLDTELVRMSHCGFFYFDDRYVKGCLQSCDDADGCNGSSRPNHFSAITIILIIPALVLISSITLPLYFLPNVAFCFHPGGATRRRLL